MIEILARPAAEVIALTPQQRAAAQLGSGTRIVLGGPGTGKTLIAAHAAAQWHAAGHSLESIIVLAQSRSAAQTLRREIVRRSGGSHVSPTVTTVHGLSLGLMRRYWPHQDSAWTLLRAPEQEQRIRELLQGMPAQGWPEKYQAAAKTRTFARQLREVLARVRQLSLDPEDLAQLARAADDDLFAAVAEFLELYLTVGDLSGSIDYSELIYRTRLLLRDEEVARSVRSHFNVVIIDDAQEADQAQLALLQDLAALGLPVLACGDPQQSVGGYRGASATALADLAQLPGAETVHLQQGFRNSAAVTAALREASRRLNARSAPLPATSTETLGEVVARVCDDETAELALVAAELRHAVTHDGLQWSDLAVLVRSGSRQLASVSKELIRLGVPVEVSGDDIVLAEQPAVAVLLNAMAVATGDATDPRAIRDLISSPLCGLDDLAQRQLLRDVAKKYDQPVKDMTQLRQFFAEPELLEGIETDQADRLQQLITVVQETALLLNNQAEVQEVLWQLWDSTSWPEELKKQALRGSQRAHADLDALVELFELAARRDELRGNAGAKTFAADISNQEIAADTGRELHASVRGVQIATAHSVRGQQWRRVWIIGMQEGLWPQSGNTGLLLDPDRITRDELLPVRLTSRLRDERQLFYLACARAQERLSVSAQQGDENTGGTPSRFLEELGVAVERVVGSPAHALSTPAVIGQLRQELLSQENPPVLRRAAALELAKISAITLKGGQPAFPNADPRHWWGNIAATPQEVPAHRDIVITGSSLETLLECPRRWFLSRKAGAESPRNSQAQLGDVVHLLARQVAEQQLDSQQLVAELEQFWPQIQFEAQWQEAAEHEAALASIGRLWNYQQHAAAELLAVEQPFDVPLEVNGSRIRIRGVIDRLELLPDGKIRVVDLKTSKRAVTKKQAREHAQLGIYQLAVMLGAFDDITGGRRELAPPQLAFLRLGEVLPLLVEQPSLEDEPALPQQKLAVGPTWVHDKLAQAVAIIEQQQFDAIRCDACRYCSFADSCPIKTLEGGSEN